MKQFVWMILTLSVLAHAANQAIYDIRGNSWLLDENMTLFLGNWRTATITPIRHGTYKNVIVNGDTTKKEITLTFDDSPDEINTYGLLDVLKEHHVKAAFFMIGGTMQDDNITVVERAYKEDHLVLNHTFNHPRLTDLNVSGINTQLEKAADKMESITGKYPILMRPPYGSINTQVIDTINAHNMTAVLWSLDSLDWTLKDPHAIVENVVKNIRNGDIILMHRTAASVGALPHIITQLKEQGYTFKRLDELLNIKPYR